ncbi:unnamed protein product [Acanthoscelides obtectus]|uniref:Uncharacterized protein n=1 Tax=Acanthoscelides obtectus TaxID=200917 RepID=A0A9P0LD88_ACAOB|nr:unnamed protein product [Acanthoscelides obtectus]CAK1658973.1 hypothetical protein AOBTE_LOCUS21217 [Acanthoscelides obtectus]
MNSIEQTDSVLQVVLPEVLPKHLNHEVWVHTTTIPYRTLDGDHPTIRRLAYEYSINTFLRSPPGLICEMTSDCRSCQEREDERGVTFTGSCWSLCGRDFQEPACQDVIEDMRECCRKWKDKSFVCNGMNITPAEEKKKD